MRHGIVPISSSLAKRLDGASVLRGKALYTHHCLSCHGANGEGDGPTIQEEDIAPANLKKLVSEVPNFQFFLSISQWQGDMPGWKEQFNPAERDDLETYIKTFALKKTDQI